MLSLIVLLAQTLTAIVAPNTPFQISFDFDNNPPASIRWWCDNAIAKNFTTAEFSAGKGGTANSDGSFTYTLSVTGLANGSHSCFVSAFNDVGESKSSPIIITVGTAPKTPINLKLVVKIGG